MFVVELQTQEMGRVVHSRVTNPTPLQVLSPHFSPNYYPRTRIEVKLWITSCTRIDVEKWLRFFRKCEISKLQAEVDIMVLKNSKGEEENNIHFL